MDSNDYNVDTVFEKISEFDWSLSNLMLIRMNLFVKISLNEWLNHPFKRWEELEEELNLN
ncbi:MAG: hypothetical protein R3A12_09055 [Ignavibacteria bacterium]